MSRKALQHDLRTLSLGTPETIALPREKGMAIRDITLRLTGTVDVTAGTVAMTQLPQGVSRLLSSIQIKKEGRETVFDVPGFLLYELNKIQYGTPGAITLAAVTNATAVATNVSLKIPIQNLLGVKPFDTLLDTSDLSTLDLLIGTGAAQTMFYAGNGTVAVNTAYTLSSVVDKEDLSEAIAKKNKNFNFGRLHTYLANKQLVSATSNNFQIKPIATGNLYKGFMLYTEDTGVAVNTLISNIKIKSGSNVILDLPANQVQDTMKLKYGITTLSTGVYYLNLMPDGYLNSCLDTSLMNTLEFEFVIAAVSGTAYIYVVAEEYFPPAIAKK
jgi:hypothetical protein